VKLKLDENLPEALIAGLAAVGHEVDNVRLEGLAGQDDAAVWRAAQESGRFLITHDLDFSDVRQFAAGTHHGLLLVRLHNPGRRVLTASVIELFQTGDVESWARCCRADRTQAACAPPRCLTFSPPKNAAP
jgi:predicted nuclease of predicted toxin-antitoxin system